MGKSRKKSTSDDEGKSGKKKRSKRGGKSEKREPSETQVDLANGGGQAVVVDDVGRKYHIYCKKKALVTPLIPKNHRRHDARVWKAGMVKSTMVSYIHIVDDDIHTRLEQNRESISRAKEIVAKHISKSDAACADAICYENHVGGETANAIKFIAKHTDNLNVCKTTIVDFDKVLASIKELIRCYQMTDAMCDGNVGVAERLRASYADILGHKIGKLSHVQ